MPSHSESEIQTSKADSFDHDLAVLGTGTQKFPISRTDDTRDAKSEQPLAGSAGTESFPAEVKKDPSQASPQSQDAETNSRTASVQASSNAASIQASTQQLAAGIEPQSAFDIAQQSIANAPVNGLSNLVESPDSTASGLSRVNGIKAPAKPLQNSTGDPGSATDAPLAANATGKNTIGTGSTATKDIVSRTEHDLQHGPQGQVSTGDQVQSGRADAAPAVQAFEASVTNGHPAQTPSHVTVIGDSKLTPAADSRSGAQTVPANVPPEPSVHPAINAARLIQSMNNSEMRVGIHSNDFGNISISASTNRDAISAQIALEHTELAKQITANLPEIREALGNRHLNVQVVASGRSAMQSDAGGSYSGNQNHRQQSYSGATGYVSADEDVVREQVLHTKPAIASTVMGQSSLDIRI